MAERANQIRDAGQLMNFGELEEPIAESHRARTLQDSRALGVSGNQDAATE